MVAMILLLLLYFCYVYAMFAMILLCPAMFPILCKERQKGGKKGVAWICSVSLLVLVVSVFPGPAQASDAEWELSRLQTQAENAMAQGDPQGAANSIGRAALLASQLDKQSDATRPPYRIMVDLFRTQEQVYRALALFQQSGERTPASSGICSLLSQGRQHAVRALEQNSATTASPAVYERLQRETMEWLETVQEVQQEWDCRQ